MNTTLLGMLALATTPLLTIAPSEMQTGACLRGDRQQCISYHQHRCDKGNLFSCNRLALIKENY